MDGRAPGMGVGSLAVLNPKGHDTRLCVLACSRSGTLYGAVFLNRTFGIDVRHERVGKNGGIGWPMMDRDPADFDLVLHQVRHPLFVFRSLGTHDKSLWRRVARHVGPLPPGKTLQRYMHYWVNWNLMAESRASFTYRLADLKAGTEVVRLISEAVGLPAKDVSMGRMNRRNGRRGFMRRMPTWAQLFRADEELASKVVEMSIRYGFPVPENVTPDGVQ